MGRSYLEDAEEARAGCERADGSRGSEAWASLARTMHMCEEEKKAEKAEKAEEAERAAGVDRRVESWRRV